LNCTVKTLLRLGCVAMLCCVGGNGPASAEGTWPLRVLAWPGYADPDVVKAFEQRHQVKVEVTFVDSDEAVWDKMHADHGGQYDVVAANTVEIGRHVRAHLLRPLDLSHFPNTARQLPRFRDLAAIDGLTASGRAYAVPFTYSSMGLIYDRTQFSTAPRSMAALWDPRYQGKVLAFNSAQHNFSLTALALGIADPFKLDAAQLHRVALQLVAIRRNILTYYNLPEEATDLFKRHQVALLFANYGTQQLSQLRQAGADVEYVIPEEGALAWLDCWAITAGTRDVTLAEAWIDYMLDPAVSSELTRRQGLANTLNPSADASAMRRLVWLRAVENVEQREALWMHIVSGDRPGPF
jgi:putative spermidine/putrescine transport system substrate-binding protein